MENASNTPSLRFRGYTDAWGQERLGDMGETFTGLSGKSKEDFGHGNAKFVTYMNVYLNPIADLKMLESVEVDNKQTKVQYGDMFFTTSSETAEEVGMSSIWLGNIENLYLNSFCFGYRLSKKMDPYFMGYLMRSPEIRNKFIFLAQGISRYNISKNHVMEMEVTFPSLEEQKKIGQLLYSVDSLLSLHQRKLDKLQAIKKSLLQKMFPAEGEDRPQIRFAGYTDAWGQEAFEDIASRKSDAGISSQDLPSVEYEDIISDDGILNKDVRGKQTGKRGILFEEGDVLYGKLRPYLHNWLKPSFNGVAVGDFWVLQPHENIDVGFLYTLIKSPMFDSVANLSSGSKMPRADWNLVSSSAFSVPSTKEEQHKIGKLFGTLDDSISLHQRLRFFENNILGGNET